MHSFFSIIMLVHCILFTPYSTDNIILILLIDMPMANKIH
jgi:hypothetical protein